MGYSCLGIEMGAPLLKPDPNLNLYVSITTNTVDQYIGALIYIYYALLNNRFYVIWYINAFVIHC